jgi:hypothetical protein
MECLDEGDEQEIALGMDTYCLVVDPGQATFYGGVRDFKVGSDTLNISWSKEAASALGMPAETVFSLNIRPDQRDLLQNGLNRVLASGRVSEVPASLRD